MVEDKQKGFTLIELMVTLVIAMVILGGLLLNFTSQSSQYKFQNKRGDAAQDLEFALRYIATDLQAALVLTSAAEVNGGTGTQSIQHDGSAMTPTSWLSFQVWSEDLTQKPPPDANMRITRCYRFRTTGTASTLWQVYYERSKPTCSATINLTGFEQVIGEPLVGKKGMRVTHFRIFQDDTDARPAFNGTAGSGYKDIPPALPVKNVLDADNTAYPMSGFTILLEVEIDAAYQGAAVDVLGNIVPSGKRHLWRYLQIYPNTVITQ